MTDRYISQLPADANSARLARGDLLFVSRGTTDFKAEVDGALFVPAATSADDGKFLGVAGGGVVGYHLPGTTANLTRLWSGTQRTNEGSSSFDIDTGKSFADYQDIVFVIEYVTRNTGAGTGALIQQSVTVPRLVLQSSLPTTFDGDQASLVVTVGERNNTRVTMRGVRRDANVPGFRFDWYIAIKQIHGLTRG